MNNEQNGRLDYSEQELREKADGFDQRFGNSAVELLNREAPVSRELVDSTKNLMQRAGDHAETERVFEQRERQEFREHAAASGGWVPGGATDAQREELRQDWQRRQEWNGLIEGGPVSVSAQERTIDGATPPAEMTKQEIVAEARELHAQFSDKMSRWEQMSPGPQKTELREEMKPLVTRENELRDEYTGRVKAEVSREVSHDQVPEMSIGR